MKNWKKRIGPATQVNDTFIEAQKPGVERTEAEREPADSVDARKLAAFFKAPAESLDSIFVLGAGFLGGKDKE